MSGKWKRFYHTQHRHSEAVFFNECGCAGALENAPEYKESAKALA